MSLVCGARYPTKELEFLDDDKSVCFPHRIGRTILVYGRKSSSFPNHVLVGPDWLCMLVTYTLIIGCVTLFIINIGITWGPAVVIPAILLALLVLTFFSQAALSDPGIIFSSTTQTLTETLQLESGNPSRSILCQFCRVQRPWNASHCYDCGVCIEDLDHHCPWTGKCIGKKTIKMFRLFLVSLWVLIAYVVCFVIIAAVRGDPVFFKL